MPTATEMHLLEFIRFEVMVNGELTFLLVGHGEKSGALLLFGHLFRLPFDVTSVFFILPFLRLTTTFAFARALLFQLGRADAGRHLTSIEIVSIRMFASKQAKSFFRFFRLAKIVRIAMFFVAQRRIGAFVQQTLN